MILLSTYYSDDQMRTSWVFKKEQEFVVEVLDNYNHKEHKHYFLSENDAECFAEEWVS
jgi:hypothetical protein